MERAESDMSDKKQKVPTTAPPISRVMDITKPGLTKSTVSATARPVIVTNRVIIQDPMVNSETETSALDPDPSAVPKTHEPVVRPLSDPAPPDVPVIAFSGGSEEGTDPAEKPSTEKETPTDKTHEPSIVPLADKPDDKPAEVSSDTPITPDPPARTDEAVTDEDEPISQKTDPQTSKDAAEIKVQEELDGLIDSREYFLPINAAVHRRSRIVAAVGSILILLLAAAWLNIALDAGFVTVPGVQPLTNFFGIIR